VMQRRALQVAISLAIVLGATPRVARAQGVRLTFPAGQLGTEFRGALSRYSGVSATRVGYLWEWVDVGMTGAVAHPQVFLLRARIRPTWIQGFSELRSETANDASRFVNYDVSASLFSGLPASLSARTRRLVGSELEVLSAGRDYDVAELGARLDFRFAPLPAYIDFRNESRVESWFPDGGQVMLRDESLRTLELRARNRKFSLDLERRDFTDRIDSRDFESIRGNVQHHFRWGKRSSLASRVVYLDRTGFMPHQRFAWAEQLHLQHTWSVASDWRYGQSKDENSNFTLRGRYAQGIFTYSPSRYVQASADGFARWNRYTTGSRNEYRAVPRISVTARLPADAVLRFHGAAGYQSVRQTATDGSVPVVNELHVVDASARFTLSERFPDPLSVVVTDVAQTVVYQPDLDYRVIDGGPLLEVVVLPQGRIVAGDTLLVDYEFRIAPDARSDGAVLSYGVAFEVRGFRAYVRRDVRDLDETGTFDLGLSQDFVTVGAGYAGTVGILQTDLRGEYQRQQFDGLEATTYLVSASVGADVHRAFRATAAATAFQKRGGVAPYDNLQGNLSLVWVPTGAIRLGARGSVWWWDEGDVRSESFTGVGLDADVRLRLMTLRVAYDRGWWDTGTTRNTDRLIVRLTRDF